MTAILLVIFCEAGDGISMNRDEGMCMIYKTVVIEDALKTKKMAVAIEQRANEMAQQGWKLVTFSVTGSGKAILVFRALDNTQLQQAAETAGETE